MFPFFTFFKLNDVRSYKTFVSNSFKNGNGLEKVGSVLVVLGVLFGLYVGIWWALVGGVFDIIAGFESVPLDSYLIGIGFLKVILYELIGVVAGFLASLPGIVLFMIGENKRKGF